MGEIVFWLVPVVLLVVLILLTLEIARIHQKEVIYVIEPLGIFIHNWEAVRFEPDNQGIRQVFKLLATSNLSERTPLEQIIIPAAGSVSLKSQNLAGTVIERQSIGTLSERYVLNLGAKKQSVILGPLEEIEDFVNKEKISRYRTLSQKSVDNGYLGLIIAKTFIHGETSKTLTYEIEGMVILEPILDDKATFPLQQPHQKHSRFLTVLPVAVAMSLYSRIFPQKIHFSLNAKELKTLLPPKFAEADLEKAAVVGGADLIARHQALRVWQRKFDCIVVSHNPEDRELPVTPIKRLS